MSQPFELQFGGLTISSSETEKCFTLKFPRRCDIHKIVVVRMSGSQQYSINLFSRAGACSDVSLSDEEGGNLLDEELFRVVPTLSSGGDGVISEIYGDPVPYANQDERDESHAPGLDCYQIHLKIRPNSAENAVYALAIRGVHGFF